MSHIRNMLEKADIIIVGSCVVGLQYKKGMSAPVVCVKDLYKWSDYYLTPFESKVFHSFPLARALYCTVEVGAEIPAELYASTAEAISKL